MKISNLRSVSYLVAASSFALLPFAGASAQTTASTTVTATVTGVLSIEAPPTASFTVNNTATSVSMGDVIVRSNQKSGYEVKVYSTNGGKLTNADSDEFSYTLSATGGVGTKSTVTPGTDSGSATTLYSSLTFQNEKCPQDVGCNLGVTLNYGAGVLDTVPVDSYTDTITYEVSAK